MESSGQQIPVLYVNGTISNSAVKTLTFVGPVSFFGDLPGYNGADDVTIEGHLNCPNLNTIIFKGNFDDNGNGNGLYQYKSDATTAPLQCPNLTDIYFQASSAPYFAVKYNGSSTSPVTWSQICTASGSNVTAHVAAWAQEECDQRHQSANVYKQLKDVVHYKDGENLVTVTASVSGGVFFQAEDFGVLSGNVIKSKDIDKSSSLTFYVYSSSNDIVVEHVYVNDTDVKDQMTTTTDGKKKYTLEGEVMQDDVVIRVVGEEKVKINVSVEVAGANNGVMFQYNNSEYIYGKGTKTYTKNKHIDYTFYVADGNKAIVKNVFVNGEDVYQDLVEVTGSENPFYDASNVRKYTIENVNSDITIRITSEETVDHYTLCVGNGGKIEFDLNNTHNSYANNNYCMLDLNKSQTLTVTATPDEGYEFESFWFEGMKLDSDLGEWITMETQADGKFVVNLALGTYQVSYTDNSYVVAFTFKKIEQEPESHWTIHVLDGMEGVKMKVSLGNVLIGENDITGVYGNHFMSKNTPRTYQLKVPVGNEGRPVRVVRNGDDLTYQFDNYADGYLYYDMHVYQDEDWIISYETSHRQTFIRKGGTENGVEVEYDFPVDGYERYYNPDNVGTPLYVDFPTYHAQEARCAYITIDVEDGKTLKVLRNGEIINVDNIFKPTSGAATGFTRRMLKESDYADGNGSTLESLGFESRDPATWEITIENASKMLNAYANNDVIVTLVKLVDGQEQNEGGLENTIHAWVNEGETYIVKFFPQHNEELTRFDIGWSPITIENESRLVKNADGSYSFTITYDQMDSKYFDILAVFETSGSARNIFVKTNSLEYTDVFIGGNRYGSLNRGSNSKMYEVPEGATFQLEPFVQQDMVKKVMLNGVDITNNETYLRQKEESMGTGKYWLYDFTSIEGDAFIDIIYVKPQFDTNEDGNVNVTDVTTLVNKILHP